MTTEPKPLRLGVVGCGDFLRIQEPAINATKTCTVTALFDPVAERARSYAARWPGSRVCASALELIESPEVDAVAIFVPPWIRRPLMEQAAAARKHIITTKPLATTASECEATIAAVERAGVRAAVMYGRSESSFMESLKRLFESDRFGQLALFKQDWIHHYPQWNNWALDPAKNGGPFMDAMIHNLNAVRYLMGRPVVRGTFFSDRHAHPDLPCADTEFMKLDFAGSGSAHLFITWAADLKHESGGNYREHIDIFYAVTDRGWRITSEQTARGRFLVASRLGETESVPFVTALENPFAEFYRWVGGEIAKPRLLASLPEAREDIRIIGLTSGAPGTLVNLG
jgi:predicted dehydrogenase